MDLCNLHTILRLPTGIFYAQGVKTNVLFFQRGKTDKANTKAVWVYDMRANMPAFGKTRPLTVEDFADFETAYGNDPNGGGEAQGSGRGRPLALLHARADQGAQRQSRHCMAARHRGGSRGTADRAGGHRRRHHRASQGGAGGDRNACRRNWSRIRCRKVCWLHRKLRNERISDRLDQYYPCGAD